ncbi:DUF2490 domain-containing protein [Sphingomonas pruni]|uniref:DUF2490 domain-containing protein n=1 Tax=Sphingomonas pruni TaxID=40683 RepID=UPI0009FBA5E7|nr:DUF2490 domain-containing protein [Sphingomonas pruni]
MSWKCHLAIGALVLMLLPSAAQADDGQIWLGANARGPVAGRVELGVETIERFGRDDEGGLYESENSAMLGFRFEHATLAAGYVRDIVYRGGGAAIEQRARQDFSVDHLAAIGPLAIGARLRVEERWRDGSSGTGVRIRPFVRLTLPVTGELHLLASHESFVNLGGGAGQRGGYDRARNFMGFGVPLTKRVGVEIGYLNQWTRAARTVGAAALTLGLRW